MNCSTPVLSEVVKAIKIEYPQCAPQMQSAFLRYLLPLLGYSTTGRRVTKREQQKIDQFLSTHSLPFQTASEWRELTNQGLERAGLKKSQQRFPRSYLNKVIDCLEKRRWTRSSESVIAASPEVLNRRKITPVVDKSALSQSQVKRTRSKVICLGSDPLEYLEIHQPLFPDKTEAEIVDWINGELTRIDKEIKDCLYFLAHKEKDPLAKASQKEWLSRIRLLLGWQLIKTQDLREVGLAKIVPVVTREISFCKYEESLKYFVAKEKIEDQLKAAADHTIQFIKGFFNEHGKDYARRTKTGHIECLIRVGKFLYKDITDENQYSRYEDIPVISRLRLLLNSLPSGSKKIKSLPLTWAEILSIRAELKKRVDDPFNYSKDSQGNIIKTPRKPSCRAKDLRRFIAFCFLTVIPPIRARTIAELEFQRTLKHGLFDDSGFIPKDKLSDPSLAQYYYHFGEGDYKTWKIYGEIIAPILNQDFGDGTCFYNYLDQLIYGEGRNSLLRYQQTHQLIFVRTQNSQKALAGDPITASIYSSIIGDITKKYANIKVSPHKFRSIYRTHLVNSGATPEELASAAYFMHHSVKMAEDSYTVQSRQEKLRPILDLMKRSH
ncbi:MAG: hypothetical protein VKJ02_05945 [Snowella sp.]|nr:hypothetical protein [Snowella sp.]